MGGAEWLELFNTLGLPVFGIFLISRGVFVPGVHHKRVLEENRELKAQVQASTEAMQEKVIPAIVEANKLLTDVAAILRDRR